MNRSNRSARPWVVVLAGGDGTRLQGAVVMGRRLARPKQFCALGGRETLLEVTLRRAERLTDPSRIVVVVREEHRHWWRAGLGPVFPANVLVQPANRGTAVAIVHATLLARRREEEPTLVLLPSDHAVEDESVLAGSIRLAAGMATDSPERVLLLGMTPEYAETGYGWILPAAGHGGPARPVVDFVEKPETGEARELLASGALWNSFIVAASAGALLELVRTAQPHAFRLCLEAFALRERSPEEADRRFRDLPALDFGRDVLTRMASRLRVLAVPACGWSDLGTRERLERWLGRLEAAPRELAELLADPALAPAPLRAPARAAAAVAPHEKRTGSARPGASRVIPGSLAPAGHERDASVEPDDRH